MACRECPQVRSSDRGKRTSDKPPCAERLRRGAVVPESYLRAATLFVLRCAAGLGIGVSCLRWIGQCRMPVGRGRRPLDVVASTPGTGAELRRISRGEVLCLRGPNLWHRHFDSSGLSSPAVTLERAKKTTAD